MAKPPDKELPIPKARIERWLAPLQRFMHVEASSGIVLIVCTGVALALANSPWSAWFLALWHEPCRIGIGDWVLKKDLLHVVNDGLMAIFFFVVGLEIKRELVVGELRHPRQAALPIVAAIGGMVVPAGLFLLLASALQLGAESRRGWAVPMATDIAFVVGVLALFGPRIPSGLKVMLLSLAIVDDLGAVAIIAVVFTEHIAWIPLGLAAVGFGVIYGLNRVGVRSVGVYVLVGAAIWLAVLKSGVHPTVAGVMLGLFTPTRAWIGDRTLRDVLRDLVQRLRELPQTSTREELNATLHQARFAFRESVPPLTRMERNLHPWVAFVIMPVFALANAGVKVELSAATDPLAAAVAAGLLIGKPLGILGLSALAVRLRLAELPSGTNWTMLAAGGCLAGIGFTMAIFLATLSLPAGEIDAGKIGILGGSLLSAVIGAILLSRTTGAATANATSDG